MADFSGYDNWTCDNATILDAATGEVLNPVSSVSENPGALLLTVTGNSIPDHLVIIGQTLNLNISVGTQVLSQFDADTDGALSLVEPADQQASIKAWLDEILLITNELDDRRCSFFPTSRRISTPRQPTATRVNTLGSCER